MIYPPKGDAFAARNKYALEIDFEEQPPMFKITETHYAASWLLHPNAPKVDPPKAVTDRIARMKGQRQSKVADKEEVKVEEKPAKGKKSSAKKKPEVKPTNSNKAKTVKKGDNNG